MMAVLLTAMMAGCGGTSNSPAPDVKSAELVQRHLTDATTPIV